MSESYVNLQNARNKEQQRIMEDLAERGVCPFCPEEFARSFPDGVIAVSQHWALVKNNWPYAGTDVHLMAISWKHVEDIRELSPEAALQLIELLQLAADGHKLTSGAIILRFGDITRNGATVRHLHAHFVSASDPSSEGYVRPRFAVGAKEKP